MKPNELRIIGGEWRSRRIQFPSRTGLRPTPDRVRETLFNWLGQTLHERACLDLFAGSGALGFEAASRGASRVVMVERDAAAYAALALTRDKLAARQVEVVRADALEFSRREQARFDVVFADPPFAAQQWPMLLPLLPALLTPTGVVYCESGGEVDLPAGWERFKEGHAGRVTFQLLKWAGHES